MYHLNIVDRC